MERLEALRKLIQEEAERLGEKYEDVAYMVPIGDEHDSEYTTEHDQRLKFISGFTGTNGYAFVAKDAAWLVTDGRFTIQVKKELSDAWSPIISTLSKTMLKGVRVVLSDPMVTSMEVKEAIERNHKYIPVLGNLVDKIWDAEVKQGKANRPPCTKKNSIVPYPAKYAGVSAADKIKRLRTEMEKTLIDGKKIDYTVLTFLDSIAWLLNLRGSDIDFTPVFKSFCLVSKTCVTLYVDLNGLTKEAKESLSSFCEFKEYDEFQTDIKKLQTDKAVCWTEPTVSVHVSSCCGDKNATQRVLLLWKSIKGDVETKRFREGHRRDSKAASKALWKMTLKAKEKGKKMTEWQVGLMIDAEREKEKCYAGKSFAHIVGSGSNGAIIHYEPEENKCDVVDWDKPLLIDTGAQYSDGSTTDLTRTVICGDPSSFMKLDDFKNFSTMYTRVLLAHFAVAEKGIDWEKGWSYGEDLDSLARVYVDFQHSTGHGVGSYLVVHEGPQRCGLQRGEEKSVDGALRVGQSLTIEPGYYLENHFGIRLENVVLVQKRSEKSNGFTFMSFVPFQTNLINMEILAQEDNQWLVEALNEYHRQCRDVVLPQLEDTNEDNEFKEWFLEQTQPIVLDIKCPTN